ncbi:MAG: M48 family metalloprotease [Janthinobacterium lividum]
MRRRPALFFVLLALFLASNQPAFARETPAEHAANHYAAQEIAAAPPLGNLPDYSLSAADLSKAQHLYAVHTSTHFGNEIWGILQLILLLWLGGIAAMRDRALRTSRNRWVQGYSFLFLFLLAGFLLDLPMELYAHHISRSYGLSVQNWGSWFGDQGKFFFLEWLVGGLVMMLLFWIIRSLPKRWWIAFWAFTIPLTLFGLFIGPYIEPLFFHYEPLAKTQPALVQRLEQVAQRGHMNIPPDRMFLMQASAKLTTLNADVEGFGHSKRVVVWDTSVQKFTPDEILFVFGHESGHYVLGHIVRGLLLGFIGSFVLLYLGFLFVRWTITRFGPRWRIPSQEDWGALAVLVLAFTFFNAVLEPISATLSRSQEHAADVYGEEAVHGIVQNPQAAAKGAFDVLGATSLDDPNPGRFREFWSYGHPATGRRAAFGKAYDPWIPGVVPKYFPPSSKQTP